MPRQRRGIRGDVGIAPYAPSTEGPCVTFGRADPSAPTTLCHSLSFPCHSEPVLTLAWESVPPSPSPTQKGRPPAALFYPQPEVALPFQKFSRRNLKLMDKSPRLPV